MGVHFKRRSIRAVHVAAATAATPMVLILGWVGDVGGRGEAYIVDVGILMILREEIVAATTVAVESTPSFQLGGTVATESGELVVVVSAAVMMMMMMMVTLTKVVLVQR